MVNRIREAIVDMMNSVEFDQEAHVYKNKKTSKFYAGVSTISDVLPKGWLAAWGGKECAKYLGYSDDGPTDKTKEMLNLIKELTENGYHNLLKEAKGASSRKSKEALVDGKEGHAWLETYVKAKIKNEKVPDFPIGMLFRPLSQFVKWAEENVKEWVVSEARIASIEHEFAGTLDAIAIMKSERLALIDFKFATFISDSYSLQTAGYVLPFEYYGIRFDDRIIVRLPKTLTRQEYDKKTRTYKEIPNEIEVHVIDTSYEFDKVTFLAARQLQKWINFTSKE